MFGDSCIKKGLCLKGQCLKRTVTVKHKTINIKQSLGCSHLGAWLD